MVDDDVGEFCSSYDDDGMCVDFDNAGGLGMQDVDDDDKGVNYWHTLKHIGMPAYLPPFFTLYYENGKISLFKQTNFLLTSPKLALTY